MKNNTKKAKAKINALDYAQKITSAIQKGVLLNTNGKKFNTMVISWGAIGTVWGVPAMTVYIRENRFTKSQIDHTGEFSVSIPAEKAVREITKICGFQSGHNIDKVVEANLTPEDPLVTNTPGIREYPITLECRVLYSQKLDFTQLPEETQKTMYPQDVDSTNPMANKDPHTMYIAEIVSAYVISEKDEDEKSNYEKMKESGAYGFVI